jgi:uncharacterized protein (DUF488 family)
MHGAADMTQAPAILTIGHSNHPLAAFVALLRANAVTAVADVRSIPYSRRHPHFGREALQRALREAGIEYVFMGKALGARSDDPACYEDGRVRYARLAATDAFREGIARVRECAAARRVALMCAEREPLDCHRTLLVGRALAAEGTPVAHIRADGSVEPHAEAMERLIRLAGLGEGDLFRSREELLEEACLRQEARIAHARAAGRA